jgi:hypothetical protein
MRGHRVCWSRAGILFFVIVVLEVLRIIVVGAIFAVRFDYRAAAPEADDLIVVILCDTSATSTHDDMTVGLLWVKHDARHSHLGLLFSFIQMTWDTRPAVQEVST